MLKLKVCIFGRCYKMMLANRVVRRLTALKLMLCRKLSNLQYVFFRYYSHAGTLRRYDQ